MGATFIRERPLPTPPYDLDAWRRRFPLLGGTIALNNCSQGPLLDTVRTAAERYLDHWNTAGMDWEGWMGEVEAARAAFARLIGAPPDTVAIASSVSDATSRLASALDLSGPRRRIVLSEAEFPTVAHVWLAQAARGAELVWLPLRDGRPALEDYARAIDERTLLVSACHAYYLTGAKQDLAAIAQLTTASGAILYADAYQTAGVSRLDVPSLGADALAAGALKYLLGTAGIAFLYVAPALAARLRPTVTGWFGRTAPFAFDPRTLDWAEGARRFDGGTPPVFNAVIARAGIEAILEVGSAAIEAWTTHCAEYLAAGGTERGLVLHTEIAAAERSPTTAFRCEKAHTVEGALREAGVLASARGPVLRLAPHFFTSEADLDRALDLLAGVAAR